MTNGDLQVVLLLAYLLTYLLTYLLWLSICNAQEKKQQKSECPIQFGEYIWRTLENTFNY